MATAEKTKEQQKQFQVPEYDSEEDYDSADDIEYSDEEEDQTPNKTQQLQRRRRHPQQQVDYDDDSDEYDSEEYDDDEDYSDDEMIQGKSMQPWSQGTTSSMAPSGGMNVVPGPEEKKKSLDDEEGMKLKLELNLEIEIELKARIHGDLTLALIISARESKGATLEDLTLSNLIIRAHGTRYNIPLNPSMKDYTEARTRLVALHKESLTKLGRSDVTLTEYRAPRGFQAIIFGLVLFTYATCWRRSNLLPGAFVYENLGFKFVPDFAHFIYTIWPVFFPSVLVIHVLESVALAVLRLRPLGVPFGSGLWFTWVGSCFIEGFGTFVRIREMVKEERVKKGGKKE